MKVLSEPVELQIAEMTLAEKLRAMEALWDDLCRREEAMPVPQWHKDFLDERERLVEQGKARFIDWETAKKRIDTMSFDQIAAEALRLPPRERALLAKSLWESLSSPHETLAEMDDRAALALARERDQQVEAGEGAGSTSQIRPGEICGLGGRQARASSEMVPPVVRSLISAFCFLLSVLSCRFLLCF